MIFLTGATGYIGSAIAAALQAANYEVSGLARSEGAEEQLRSRGIQAIRGDLRDRQSLVLAAQHADAVIHVAATNDAQMASIDRSAVETFLDTLEGTNKPFIYTSGTWVLGDTGTEIADELSLLNPTPLIAWRAEIEPLVLAANRGVRGIVIRPALVYGRGGGIIAMLVHVGRQAGAVQMIGNGENHWTLVHVDDLADCYVRALEQAPAGTLLNAASEQILPVKQIARAASQAAGIPGQVQSLSLHDARQTMGPLADALLLDQRVSGLKARQLLGWTPQAPSVLEELERGS